MAERLNANEAGLAQAAALLNQGAVVAVPTETVYGLAANAFDEDACRAIFTIKGRPLMDPLIVHCADLEGVRACVEAFPEEAAILARRFWPGPLTLVLEKSGRIPAIVSSGLPSVAVRVPAQPEFRRLLGMLSYPLAAPSANPFGYISPTSADHVERTLGSRIPAILDGGPCAFGLESTIVDLRDPRSPAILRPGPIPLEQLEEALGCKFRIATTPGRAQSDTTAQAAPGMLETHYSPRLPMELHQHGKMPHDPASAPRSAHVFWKRPQNEPGPNVFWLTEDGDDHEAAHRLFDLLNRLDVMDFEKIVIESAPTDCALALAINDRLRRAASR